MRKNLKVAGEEWLVCVVLSGEHALLPVDVLAILLNALHVVCSGFCLVAYHKRWMQRQLGGWPTPCTSAIRAHSGRCMLQFAHLPRSAHNSHFTIHKLTTIYNSRQFTMQGEIWKMRWKKSTSSIYYQHTSGPVLTRWDWARRNGGTCTCWPNLNASPSPLFLSTRDSSN